MQNWSFIYCWNVKYAWAPFQQVIVLFPIDMNGHCLHWTALIYCCIKRVTCRNGNQWDFTFQPEFRILRLAALYNLWYYTPGRLMYWFWYAVITAHTAYMYMHVLYTYTQLDSIIDYFEWIHPFCFVNSVSRFYYRQQAYSAHKI